MSKNDFISKGTLSKQLGIAPTYLRNLAFEGKIQITDEGIPIDQCKRLIEERETYISVDEFTRLHQTERYNPQNSKDRSKLRDFLEENNYFGIKIIDSRELLLARASKIEKYIERKHIVELTEQCAYFLEWFGYTPREITDITLKRSIAKPNTVRYLKEFLMLEESRGVNINVLKVSQLVQDICDMPDILSATDKDTMTVYSKSMTVSKTIFLHFLDYVRDKARVKYGIIKQIENKEKNTPKAYNYDEYVKIAGILFNKKYAMENNLLKKAFENPLYAKMWLYLSAHFTCAWRSADICDNWIYPKLEENNIFGINIRFIKEDILTGRINDKELASVADYVINKINMSSNTPSKTSGTTNSTLKVEMLPELKPFFGTLILIGEYHQRNGGNGHMDKKECGRYQSWVILKTFFGERMLEALGRKNISSLRLNKSYEQGLVASAKQNDATPLTSILIAAYARNHENLSSTIHYLQDHNLNGETAGFVLYTMMQRGVFGAYAYAALTEAFPDSFKYLTMTEQTEIIKMSQIQTYEIETTSSLLLAQSKLKEAFVELRMESVKEILMAMLAICNGRGKSKDDGVYCLRRALGKSCICPEHETCIGNLCEYAVFTTYGVKSLIDVIKDFMEKTKRHDGIKYKVALSQYLIPAFHQVLNEVMKTMTHEDAQQTKIFIKEAING